MKRLMRPQRALDCGSSVDIFYTAIPLWNEVSLMSSICSGNLRSLIDETYLIFVVHFKRESRWNR
jgi:hypothetical protein